MSLAAGVEGSSPALNISDLRRLRVITLVDRVPGQQRANSSASDYYTAGGAFTGPQNGIAISGDYLSAASFLGIAGAIALYGYDGFLYSIGFLVAWLVALLLVAELLRNTGRFTMGDVLAFRMRQRPVRAAAATSTLAVSFFYLLAQMAGAGGLVALLLDVDGQGGPVARHRGRRRRHDRLRAHRRHAGHDLGADHQGRAADRRRRRDDDLGARPCTASTSPRCSATPSPRAARRARSCSGRARSTASPGITKLDFISLALALVLGTAGLPHILMRFYTVPTAQGGAPLGGVGDRPDRPVLPVHAGARLRRGRARRPGRRSTPPRARPTRPRRCWPTSSAARCCSASSPRWRSRRSSRWSPV